MRRLAPLVLLLTVLAGCATPAADLDPAAAGDISVISFGAPVAMAQPTGGAEPNLAIAPDGTLWITAVAGSQERPNHERGAAWLWRSTDNGTTWETLRAPVRETPLGSLPQTRRPFGSSDADVVTSPDGWVYYSDWWNWGSPVLVPQPVPLPLSPNARYGSYMVERSNDGGATWASSPITTLDSLGGIDRQWLVAGPDGWVGLFYAYFHGPNPARGAQGVPDGRSSIQAVYSTDHGETWSEPRPVVVSPPGEFAQISHPRLTPQGLLWMPHGWTKEAETYWTDPSEVRVALSTDRGLSWRVVKVADVPGGFDNLWAVQGAHEPDGTLHVAWAERDGDLMTVRHSRSRDAGATWTAPENVSAPGLGFLPWVAARAGEVAVGYYWANATGDPLEVPDGTAWSAVVARKGATGGWARVDASAEPVKLGPLCPRGAACPADRELLDYFSLDYEASGRLHVAYAVSREVGGAKAGLVTYVGSANLVNQQS
ncbi:MAG TPA: exo-alpha-sialidase [Candidatus Thermoplasmatota archaeon]|nr:exo-alpha-sialidase [Candidatus Thermoplasmatota archaeon]